MSGITTELRETIVRQAEEQITSLGMPVTHANRHAFYTGLMEAWLEDDEQSLEKSLCKAILANLILAEYRGMLLEARTQ